MANKLKVLLIIEQCNPSWPSVPLVGYNFFEELNKLADVTLVTHARNKQDLEKKSNSKKIFYIAESDLTKKYYKFIANLTTKGRINWPLHHTLSYPIYSEFNNKVYQQFKQQILRGDYDIVHSITPMMPRYPVKVVKLCQNTPFIIGPVNGGVPFPKGFQEIAKKEFANLNFLKRLGRLLIPGYAETYKQADKVLSGSTYTLNMLKALFEIKDHKISLFYENGIAAGFINQPQLKSENKKVELLFVGRLVPYKGTDILIEAISELPETIKAKVNLTIVGDGSEKASLEAQVQQLNLENIVAFAGWVPQEKTLEYYQSANIFCFPSIREFGGAVVLEAMASGLPCIVADNGGISEYVTEETGFKIPPISREYLIQELKKKITILVEDQQLREYMSIKSIERAKEFEWGEKAKKVVEIYEKILIEKGKLALVQSQKM